MKDVAVASAPPRNGTLLSAEAVTMRFGALIALDAVTLAIAGGERRAVIGPNGAGKTTLFHIISGELQPSSGSVSLMDRDVTRLRVHERARMGLARTFQLTNLFFRLSVLENVRLAVQVHRGLGAQFLRPANTFEEVRGPVDELLDRVDLTHRRRDRVAELSYGEQRQLELALALASEPRILLLDEPTAGMSPAETTRMVELIGGLPRSMTVILIEHDMDVVAALADNITVMHYGRVLADGPASQVRRDPRVQAVYLGDEARRDEGTSL